MYISDGSLDHLRQVSDAPDLRGTKYRLLAPLGRGGMAAVYTALDVELDRLVAIKVSSSLGNDALCTRLRLEARVIARLEHPGIVPVHDIGVLPDGRVYYVMKLVRGERLDQWLDHGHDLRAALRLLSRVCEAVAFAHAQGVIHRDLKPENVMVGEFGEAMVMDWGLAKALAGAPQATTGDAPGGFGDGNPIADTLPAGATAMGTVMGTAAYMPPEQARGEVERLDARSDVHALGAILYFLLAKRPPYGGASAREVVERVVAGAPRPLREIVPALPRPLGSICEKAMAREQSARYASALELGNDIDAFLEGLPVTAHRETVLERAARFSVRHRTLLSLLAAYLIVRIVLALATR